MKEIIVYTSNFCGYCGAAKQWLQNNELDFTEINLDEGNEREKFMGKQGGGQPQLGCLGSLNYVA